MALVKSQIQTIFDTKGILNSEYLETITLEHEDEGVINLAKILKSANGKFVKITLTSIEEVDVPLVE